mgnify:CR=1 FL=1
MPLLYIIGTGQIFKLKMNETDFSQSEFVDNITIINQPGPINFVGIDITRNYLYAATYGPTTAHPPVVWRYALCTWPLLLLILS